MRVDRTTREVWVAPVANVVHLEGTDEVAELADKQRGRPDLPRRPSLWRGGGTVAQEGFGPHVPCSGWGVPGRDLDADSRRP